MAWSAADPEIEFGSQRPCARLLRTPECVEFVYDALDNLVEESSQVLSEDVGVGAAFLTTQYRYDANQKRILVILPEGNRTETLYDERDLPYQITRGSAAPRLRSR